VDQQWFIPHFCRSVAGLDRADTLAAATMSPGDHAHLQAALTQVLDQGNGGGCLACAAGNHIADHDDQTARVA